MSCGRRCRRRGRWRARSSLRLMCYGSSDITAWWNSTNLRDAIRRVEGNRIRVEASQVIDGIRARQRDRTDVWRILSDSSGAMAAYARSSARRIILVLHPVWPVEPGQDWEENGVKSMNGAPSWRGLKHGQKKEEPRDERNPDPDYMPDYWRARSCRLRHSYRRNCCAGIMIIRLSGFYDIVSSLPDSACPVAPELRGRDGADSELRALVADDPSTTGFWLD